MFNNIFGGDCHQENCFGCGGDCCWLIILILLICNCGCCIDPCFLIIILLLLCCCGCGGGQKNRC